MSPSPSPLPSPTPPPTDPAALQAASGDWELANDPPTFEYKYMCCQEERTYGFHLKPQGSRLVAGVRWIQGDVGMEGVVEATLAGDVLELVLRQGSDGKGMEHIRTRMRRVAPDRFAASVLGPEAGTYVLRRPVAAAIVPFERLALRVPVKGVGPGGALVIKDATAWGKLLDELGVAAAERPAIDFATRQVFMALANDRVHGDERLPVGLIKEVRSQGACFYADDTGLDTPPAELADRPYATFVTTARLQGEPCGSTRTYTGERPVVAP